MTRAENRNKKQPQTFLVQNTQDIFLWSDVVARWVTMKQLQ